MENINSRYEKTLINLIYGSLMILAIGLVTSMSMLALSHILIIIPALYFLPKVDYKKVSLSAWALLVLSIIIVLSVLVNQDIAINGFKPVSKVKYFLFGILMIFPFSYYFMAEKNSKKISYLLYAFCIATTIATLAGIGGMLTEFNFILMKKVNPDRNGGVFGMLMNYAHNMVYFQVIILGMVFNKKYVEKYINMKFLYVVLVINLIGFYLTYTRGAWLGFLVAIPFFFFKKNIKTFLSIVIALVIIGGGVYFVAGKSIVRPQSDNERLSQWKAAIKAFEERPIMGYGYLNFETHSKSIKERYGLGELQFIGHAHNNFFEMLATTGILGFVTYIVWLGFWFIEMYKRDDVVGRIGLPFIVAFVAGGLTQSTVSLGINLFFVMAVYALTMVKKDLLA